MRKLFLMSLGAIMIVLVAGCSAGIGPHGAGASIGYNETAHYSA